MENTADFKVYEQQIWEDISIYLYGKADYAMDLAILNNMSVTEDIAPGKMIKIFTDKELNRLVLYSLQSNNSVPATAVDLSMIEAEPEGIGYWIIKKNFIVK
ncbi:hypothetical protein ACM39_02605 [Chryseobacterium sp. FH2]|uniref:hypothetical protein n=1 Tax=Chryseobacterium sp. FH2 TaxID=1674291 RepID=UPI00065A930F|nr:hypothetical protein [Chryseobacterium sp. FH2]KMQ69949.1 hypothetical protein ACM39_02605 [Chryseobacterium sp. FH2]